MTFMGNYGDPLGCSIVMDSNGEVSCSLGVVTYAMNWWWKSRDEKIVIGFNSLIEVRESWSGLLFIELKGLQTSFPYLECGQLYRKKAIMEGQKIVLVWLVMEMWVWAFPFFGLLDVGNPFSVVSQWDSCENSFLWGKNGAILGIEA